jgi:hypothetical protein
MEAHERLNPGEGWSCTDPDNLQYSKENQDGTYAFREFDKFHYPDEFKQVLRGAINLAVDLKPRYWVTMTIDLDGYTIDEIDQLLKTYGYIGNETGWVDGCGCQLTNEIIAECVFEQESGLY